MYQDRPDNLEILKKSKLDVIIKTTKSLIKIFRYEIKNHNKEVVFC